MTDENTVDIISKDFATQNYRGCGYRQYKAVIKFTLEHKASSAKLRERAWQPIETAPKDEKIDLFQDGIRYTECHKDGGIWRYISLIKLRNGCMGKGRMGNAIGFVDKPTHWMHISDLPAPPKKEKTDD